MQAMDAELEQLRKRNMELEREVSKAREREAELRRELEHMSAQLHALEDAEERLCADLGDREAEAAAYVHEYEVHVAALTQRLALVQRTLASAGLTTGAGDGL